MCVYSMYPVHTQAHIVIYTQASAQMEKRTVFALVFFFFSPEKLMTHSFKCFSGQL